MTLSKANPRARQRWALLITTVAVLLLGVASVALATRIDGFEIDAAEAAGERAYYSGNNASGGRRRLGPGRGQ